MATQPDMLQDEIARRTGQGWVLVLRDAAEAQMRKPKRFSLLWFLAWTILSVGTLFWVYLIWHWAKSDQLIFLRVVEGQLVVTGGGRGGDGALFAPFAAYWRWAGERPSTQGKVLAYGGPVAAVVILIIIISVAGSAGGGEDGDGEQVAGQPTEAAPDDTGTQEPADQETAEPTQPPEPTQGLPELTTAECTYLNTFGDQLETIGSAMAEFGDLFAAPELFSDEWIIDVAIQLAILRLAYDDATALDPPQSLAAVHGSYISAITKLNDATFLIAEGIDNIDADSINEAANLMVEATTDINTGTDQIVGFAATRSGSC